MGVLRFIEAHVEFGIAGCEALESYHADDRAKLLPADAWLRADRLRAVFAECADCREQGADDRKCSDRSCTGRGRRSIGRVRPRRAHLQR
jgi:hypothetical protein